MFPNSVYQYKIVFKKSRHVIPPYQKIIKCYVYAYNVLTDKPARVFKNDRENLLSRQPTIVRKSTYRSWVSTGMFNFDHENSIKKFKLQSRLEAKEIIQKHQKLEFLKNLI